MRATKPKYLTIKHDLLEQIRKGVLTPGCQIPSIAEIMEQFRVSKVTAVRALADLENEGIVRREHGRGTFVTDLNMEEMPSRMRKIVSVIVPDMANPFHVEVVGSLEKNLRDQSVAIELSATDYGVDTEKELFHRITREKRVSGAVLISVSAPHSLVEEPLPKIPIVVIDFCPPDLIDRCVFISSDNFKGGYDAASHLASLGHRKIGYINYVYGGLNRFDGFRKGLEDNGILLGDNRIFMVGPEGKLEERLIQFVINEQLTALFAMNDMLAMQAMKMLRSHGFEIPGDISIMGYDDVVASKYLEIPLTTIEQHEEQIGRLAAERLLEGLHPDGIFKPREILIVPQLVVRASTAPPPEKARP